MINPAILILAAGQSRRMRGRNKLVEKIDGTPLIRVLADQTMATSLPVYVVLHETDGASQNALLGSDVSVVTIGQSEPREMSHSLSTGIAALPDGTSHAVIMLGDMPEITQADIEIMIKELHRAPHEILRGASTIGGAISQAGHPVIFPVAYFDKLIALQGDTGAKFMQATNMARQVSLPGNHATTDLDTPEDWQRWRDAQIK